MMHTSRMTACMVTVAALMGAIAIGAAVPALAGGKPGESGMLSLRMPVGARESAMGGAGVASVTGAAAAFWNPSRLLFAPEGTALLLQHQRLFGLFNKENLCVTHRAGGHLIGFQFNGFFADAIDRYGDEPVGVPEGSFKPYDVAVGVSYAREVVPDLAVGATLKVLHQKIDLYGDTGYAVDIAVTHRATIPGLYFAAALTNAGPRMQLRDEAFSLPTSVRVGAAYDPSLAALAGKITVAADVVMPNDGNEKAHVGAEYRLLPELALRVGTRIAYDNQGLTAGLGLRRAGLGVGYAFEESKVSGLDDSHKFSLELSY